jgi:hypothetical protein
MKGSVTHATHFSLIDATRARASYRYRSTSIFARVCAVVSGASDTSVTDGAGQTAPAFLFGGRAAR